MEQHGALAGLVSAEAQELYDRLASASPLARLLAVGGDVDPEDLAFQELSGANLLHYNSQGRVWVVSELAALQLLISQRIQQAAIVHTSVVDGLASLERILGAQPGHAGPGLIGAGAGAEFLTDRREISRLSFELHVSARRDLRSTVIGRYEVPPTTDQRTAPSPAAKQDGIRFRTLYDAEFASLPSGREIIQLCVAAGEEARIRGVIPTKLIHVDDQAALVALTDTGMDGALLVHSPRLLRLISEWFDVMWDAHGTIEVGDTNAAGLSPGQLRVLTLMASALTDEAIARSLDMSVRTVRRNVGAIMEILGVSTRFAAGAAAVKRGWI